MSPIFRDRLGSVAMLVFVAVLWVQRDYSSPFGGMFPDTIMIFMAALIVLALLLSFTRYASPPAKSTLDADTEQPDQAINHGHRVLVVIIILALWVTLYRPVGYALSSILSFAFIAWYLGDRKNSLRNAFKALGFAALISFVVYMVFDYFLLVPLPPGFLFN